jgi:hypothetical protein
MHFINALLLSILALAVSPALSAPILPNVDSLEARSIGDGSVDKRFIPDPTVAVTVCLQHDAIATSTTNYFLYHQLLQPHRRSLAIEKRGSDAPWNISPDGRDHPHFVISHPVTENPTSVTSNDKSKHLSRRDNGSEATEKEKPQRPFGRIVRLGKKLARLFYHPSHKNAVTSQAKITSHGMGQKGDEDKEGEGDD